MLGSVWEDFELICIMHYRLDCQDKHWSCNTKGIIKSLNILLLVEIFCIWDLRDEKQNISVVLCLPMRC